MKRHIFLIASIALVLGMSSCKNNNNSNSGAKKFNPTDRTTSTMSDDERQAAIALKKAELSVDTYEMMTMNDVKMSILPPYPNGDITEEMSELIAVKMLQLIATNGIGGLNTVPGFALGATITPGERRVTNTAPQKMVTTYKLGYQVLNLVTGDVYATSEEEITGVGASFEEATRNAVMSIKNSSTTTKFLSEGSKKIIEWFETNLSTFKSQVDAACSDENYALALALIESVPQAATSAFEYAQTRHPELLSQFQEHIAAIELAKMKQAISMSSPLELSTEVYAHMQMLPMNTSIYKQAEQLLADYEAQIFKNQAEKEQREREKVEAENQKKIAEAKQAEEVAKRKSEQATAEAKRKNAQADAEAQRAHEIELAKIEAERMKAQYQATAAEESYKKQLDVQRGFWGNLGARIIDVLDR